MPLCSNHGLALCARLFSLAVCVLALVISLPGKGAAFYTYFTIQTNIFVTALFAVLTVQTARGAKVPEPLQLAVTLFITITFVIYWTLLDSSGFSMTGMNKAKLSNLLLHGAVPILAILDWIIFMPHGQVGWQWAAIWLIYPALYCAGALVLGGLKLVSYGAAHYPYFFIDAQRLTRGALIRNIALLSVGFYLLGLLYTALDKGLAKLIGR